MSFTPADVARYHVYHYHHIDFQTFIRRPEELHGVDDLDDQLGPSPTEWPAFRAALEVRFTQAGWEGDGSINVFWLPPFTGAGVEDGWGILVWHVKQSNNGTSFLACQYPLPFEPLLQQNG